MRAVDTSISNDVRLKSATAAAARCLDLTEDTRPHMQFKAATVDMQMQIDDLRSDRARLLHTIQGATARTSERAIRFVGLMPEHVEKLRSYAMQLTTSPTHTVSTPLSNAKNTSVQPTSGKEM
mmetsp:Transcript_30678/g.94900  ORF Transcript_30678/g.94900 Transcript_30678/m.94900 type:complete len:123 (-) Transcript_30678:905-1273(-)